MNGQASRIIQLSRMAGSGYKSPLPKIISVCSGKGGTGKSFFAANFAYALSKTGRKILLIDFDLNFSNLNIMLNRTTDCFLSEFFEKKKSLEELVSGYLPNLDLIFGDSGRHDHPHINRDELGYFFISLSRLVNRYDYIILDSAAGADRPTLYQLTKSNFNILVTSPEPTAIMDAYVVVKLLKYEESGVKNFVVVNKCSNAEEGRNAFSNLAMASKHFLGVEPEMLGWITFDAAVHQSILNQELYLSRASKSKIAGEISSIVKHFELTTTHVANNDQKLRSENLKPS